MAVAAVSGQAAPAPGPALAAGAGQTARVPPALVAGVSGAAAPQAHAGASAPPKDAAVPDVDAGPALDAGAALPPDYSLGADITWVQADEARGATYSDGAQRDILALLKAHGFNAIRLRTFVDPRASDGYDREAGFGDLAHTIAFAKRIRAAGLSLLLDFHYSDNWADPGKQCVPVAWQDLRTTDALAAAVHDYTRDALAQLSAAGAAPQLVQIGNEITSGLLLHRCDARGQPLGMNPVNGSISSWSNLGQLLSAAARAVRETDPRIRIVLHIDAGDDLASSRSFIEHARAEGVSFDVFAESCYTAYQGTPATWRSTLMRLGELFPQLQLMIAEYGPEQRAANDVVYGLPSRQGVGTFNWEPTHEGDWNRGHALFRVSGAAYTATAELGLYDAMRQAYADRL